MGIINVTPDSFYKGHLNEGTKAILTLAQKMISEGADILDIGGQSSRPGSQQKGCPVGPPKSRLLADGSPPAHLSDVPGRRFGRFLG